MRLFFSTTSPYARLVRIALIEKDVSAVEEMLMDPWSDAIDHLAVNPSARVPVLVLDNGLALTESQLIVMWLESAYPEKPLVGADSAAVLSQFGVAMGGIDAAAAIIIGRRTTEGRFDELPVGLRRRRSIIESLRKLDASLVIGGDDKPTISMIATVVLLDYLHFRFPKAEWMPEVPRLDALRRSLQSRRSFELTSPREMPAA